MFLGIFRFNCYTSIIKFNKFKFFIEETMDYEVSIATMITGGTGMTIKKK